MIVNYDINSNGGGASAEGCLRYDEAQDLTAEQQAQAKENLGIEEPEPQPLTVETTYTALKALRDGGNLVPGTLYRITDYATTTTDPETQSAGHVFDIIVSALGERTLSEEARAIQHDGDTYFADSNLAAWKLWYCLDNDVERFAWADPDDGKGVICRMIDEFGNDVGYDFKNIMFKRYQISECSVNDNLVGLYLGMPYSGWHENDTTRFKYMYTFCAIDADWECHDLSILGNNGTVTDSNVHDTGCKNNVFKPAFEKPNTSLNLEHQMLNNGVFVTEFNGPYWHYCGCSGNRTGVGCRNWTYSDRYVDNGNPKTDYSHSSPWTCGNDCSNWMITGGLSYWTADDNAQNFYINSDGGEFRLLSGRYGGKVIPENLYMKTIGFDSDDNLRVWNIADETTPEPQAAVLYTEQTLTDAQKQQARTNIGAKTVQYSFSDSDDFIDNFIAVKQSYDDGLEVMCDFNELTSYEYDPETHEPVAVTLCMYAKLILLRAVTGAHSSRNADFIGVATVTRAQYDDIRVLCRINIELFGGELKATLSPASPYGVVPSDIDGKQYCIKNGKWTEIAGGGQAVQSDWNETDTDDPAYIKNKPTIPTVNNPTVTIKQGGTTKGTFTLNQGSAATIDLDAGGGEAVQSDWNETDTDDPAYIKNKPAIPQAENHQLLKSALSEAMGCSANTWATLAEVTVPEDGVYQVSASVRAQPYTESTYSAVTACIETYDTTSGATELQEIQLPRSGEYGTMAVPVEVQRGKTLRLRAYSAANFYAQAAPSVGKASATFIAAVRVGAIYQD